MLKMSRNYEVYDNLKEVVIKEPSFFGTTLLSAFYHFKGYNVIIVSGQRNIKVSSEKKGP